MRIHLRTTHRRSDLPVLPTDDPIRLTKQWFDRYRSRRRRMIRLASARANLLMKKPQPVIRSRRHETRRRKCCSEAPRPSSCPDNHIVEAGRRALAPVRSGGTSATAGRGARCRLTLWPTDRWSRFACCPSGLQTCGPIPCGPWAPVSTLRTVRPCGPADLVAGGTLRPLARLRACRPIDLAGPQDPAPCGPAGLGGP